MEDEQDTPSDRPEDMPLTLYERLMAEDVKSQEAPLPEAVSVSKPELPPVELLTPKPRVGIEPIPDSPMATARPVPNPFAGAPLRARAAVRSALGVPGSPARAAKDENWQQDHDFDAGPLSTRIPMPGIVEEPMPPTRFGGMEASDPWNLAGKEATGPVPGAGDAVRQPGYRGKKEWPPDVPPEIRNSTLGVDGSERSAGQSGGAEPLREILAVLREIKASIERLAPAAESVTSKLTELGNAIAQSASAPLTYGPRVG